MTKCKFVFCLIALSFLILNISIGASSEVSPPIIIRTGESVDLGSGWALEAKQVDVDGEKVWLELSRYGSYVDDSILYSGDSYNYDANGFLFDIYVDDIYQGPVDSIAKLDITISNNDDPVLTEYVLEETPIEETPIEEPVEEPVEETPIEETPIEESSYSSSNINVIFLLLGVFSLIAFMWKKKDHQKTGTSSRDMPLVASTVDNDPLENISATTPESKVNDSKVTGSKLTISSDNAVTQKEHENVNFIVGKTAFGYKGATIIYKVKVENPTNEPIGDIKVSLFVPDIFLLNEKEKAISMLEPGESKTVTYEIRPTGECGDCNVSGIINYYDYKSKGRKQIELNIKSLSIVCPVLHMKEINKEEWKNTISSLLKTEETTKELSIPVAVLFNISSRVISDMNMFMLKPEITSTGQLVNGVVRYYGEGVKDRKYAAMIEVVGGSKKSRLILKAWAEHESELTGFYYRILDELEKRIHIKEYIDDTIVQNFYHYGNKIGTQITDSVVQRSNIGIKFEACSKCGKERTERENYCSACGNSFE